MNKKIVQSTLVSVTGMSQVIAASVTFSQDGSAGGDAVASFVRSPAYTADELVARPVGSR